MKINLEKFKTFDQSFKPDECCYELKKLLIDFKNLCISSPRIEEMIYGEKLPIEMTKGQTILARIEPEFKKHIFYMLDRLNAIKNDDSEEGKNIVLKIGFYRCILMSGPRYNEFSNWIKRYYIRNNINCQSNIFHVEITEHINDKCQKRCQKIYQRKLTKCPDVEENQCEEERPLTSRLMSTAIIISLLIIFIIFIIFVIYYFIKGTPIQNKNKK